MVTRVSMVSFKEKRARSELNNNNNGSGECDGKSTAFHWASIISVLITIVVSLAFRLHPLSEVIHPKSAILSIDLHERHDVDDQCSIFNH